MIRKCKFLYIKKGGENSFFSRGILRTLSAATATTAAEVVKHVTSDIKLRGTVYSLEQS